MSLGNYGDLQEAVAEWLYRTGDANIAVRAPDLISLFENEFVLDPEMRTLEMEQVDQAPITSAVIPLPDGFLEMVYIQILGSPNKVLNFVSPSTAAVMNASTMPCGVVQYYTIMAGQIFLVPQQYAPISATIEMGYYAFDPLGTSITGTNWLMAKYPNIYLYGSLMQAAGYVDDKDTVGFWSSAYNNAKGNLGKSDNKRKLGASPLFIQPSMGFIA